MKKHFLGMMALSLAASVAVRGSLCLNDARTDEPVGCIAAHATLWHPHSPGSLTASDTLLVSHSYTSGTAFRASRSVAVAHSNGIPFTVNISTQSAGVAGQTTPALTGRVTGASKPADRGQPAEATLLPPRGLASLMFVLAVVALFASWKGSIWSKI